MDIRRNRQSSKANCAGAPRQLSRLLERQTFGFYLTQVEREKTQDWFGFRGATVNQFVVQTAYQEAQRILERESVIRLSQADARRVFALLDTPPKPAKALKDAVKAYRGSVRA